jgi:hypothetical protein
MPIRRHNTDLLLLAMTLLRDGMKPIRLVIPLRLLRSRLEILAIFKSLFFKTFFGTHGTPRKKKRCGCT